MSLLLFFDGDCGFCCRTVRAIYSVDKRGLVDFSPLQGKLSGEHGLQAFAEKSGGSMVIIRESDGANFFKCDALIELGKTLGGMWGTLAAFISIFPKAARDRVYDFVAKNRYRLARKDHLCELPDEGLQRRIRI